MRDEGFEPQTTGVIIKKVPRFYEKRNLSNLLSDVAGDEVARWNPITDRMSLIVQRLAEQGYVYDKTTKTMSDLCKLIDTG